jgi:thiamine-phosphate pyrophosphorylase
VSLPVKSARRPILCYVTDSRALTEDPANRRDALLERIAAASAAGIEWIQIREKDLSGREISALTAAAIAKTKNSTQLGTSSAKIIVNDRVDVAIANHAQGLHLGGNSMPAKNICDWLKGNADRHEVTVRQNFEVGVSCHSLKEALVAEKSGATYIFFGPIFATPSKQTFGPPQGLSRLAEVCNAVKIPVLAIGGITTENAQTCLNAGAAGLAAIRLFQELSNLNQAVTKVRPGNLP